MSNIFTPSLKFNKNHMLFHSLFHSSARSPPAAAGSSPAAAGHRKRSTFVLLQFVSDRPLRPVDTAPLEDREAYAAYALTVFYSEHYVKDLEGSNMLEQLRSWEDLTQ